MLISDLRQILLESSDCLPAKITFCKIKITDWASKSIGNQLAGLCHLAAIESNQTISEAGTAQGKAQWRNGAKDELPAGPMATAILIPHTSLPNAK